MVSNNSVLCVNLLFHMGNEALNLGKPCEKSGVIHRRVEPGSTFPPPAFNLATPGGLKGDPCAAFGKRPIRWPTFAKIWHKLTLREGSITAESARLGFARMGVLCGSQGGGVRR
jgi:hypothetical protein